MRLHCKSYNLIIILGTLLAVNILIFYFVSLFLYSSVWTKLSSLHIKEGWTSHQFFNQNEELRNLVAAGKDGGFVSLAQETLGRLFSVSQSIPNQKNETLEKTISFIGIDVSHSGEVFYIYKRILSRRSFPFTHLVIDIGANDGYLSSNSLNFIQLGWDAVLVEPLTSQIEMAKKNGKRFADPYGDKRQKVQYEQAAIGEADGFVEFLLTKDVSSMQNHLLANRNETSESMVSGNKVKVRCLSVKTLAEKYHVPIKFAVLSIDAEGVGDKVIHQWIELGYRPAFIIYESMYNKEPLIDTTKYLAKVGYRHLTQLGWNQIYELEPLRY